MCTMVQCNVYVQWSMGVVRAQYVMWSITVDVTRQENVVGSLKAAYCTGFECSCVR